MWLKLLLLSLCLLVLFLISRIVESTLFLETGFLSTSLIDPVSLGVRELKRILAFRGVSYVGVLEKQELTSLVFSSGHLSDGELAEANSTARAEEDSSSSTSSTTYFTCGSHFYEEVEDTKDSVWLLQVIPTHSELPLLDDLNWKRVRNKLQPFGIRTGIFKCQLDPKLCKRKGWFERQLVLAMPQGVHPKDNVIYKPYFSSSKSSSAIHWVRNELTSRLKHIESSLELENVWLRFDDGSDLGTDVRTVLILPNRVEPPLFFSSLSTKFSGRMTFGVLNFSIADPIFKKLPHLEKSSSASYVIITPEGIFDYGKRVGEHLNFKRMELTLRTLQPEMNDVFVWSMTIVNFLVLFDAFFIYDKVWKHTVRCFWLLVKNNLILFLLWLSIFGLSKFHPMTTISNILLKLARQFSILEISSVLRNDFMFWKSYPWLIIGMFIVICAVHAWVRQRWFSWTIPNGSENGDFVTILTNLFFPPMVNLRRPAVLDREIAREMDQLIERLAMPNLWLQPVLSKLDYLDELPVWRHCANLATKMEDETSNESSNSSGSSSSSDLEQNYVVVDEQGDDSSQNNQHRITNFECYEFSCSGTGLIFACHSIGKTLKKIVVKCRRLFKLLRSKKRSANTNKKLGRRPPPGMVVCSDCAICLEGYSNNELICGLPCGHNYHQRCILGWILRDHHQCPSCRWPTNDRRLHN